MNWTKQQLEDHKNRQKFKLAKILDSKIPDLIKIENNCIFLSGNVPSSKNSKRIFIKSNGTPFITESALCEKYRKHIKAQMMTNKMKFLCLIKDKKLPLIVQLYFIRSTKQQFDFNNISQILADLMQEYGWINNDNLDNLIVIPPLPPLKQYEVNKAQAGVVIKII